MTAEFFPFVLVGNRAALDFVNTELVEAEQTIDLLHSDADLMNWARQAQLLTPDRSAAGSGTILDRRVRPLRSALRTVFESQVDGRKPSAAALARLNGILTRATRLAPLELERNRVVWSEPPPVTPGEILQLIARDAAGLLTSGDLRLLRRCANHRCILLFYDDSRTGRRRWCSMSLCGNRAKVAAHHERSKNRS